MPTTEETLEALASSEESKIQKWRTYDGEEVNVTHNKDGQILDPITVPSMLARASEIGRGNAVVVEVVTIGIFGSETLDVEFG